MFETYRVYFYDPVSGERKPSVGKLEPGGYKKEANNPYRDDGSVHEYCPSGGRVAVSRSACGSYNGYDPTPSDTLSLATSHIHADSPVPRREREGGAGARCARPDQGRASRLSRFTNDAGALHQSF